MNLFRPLLIAGLLLAHPYANATSFDCQRGRSPTERMICGDPALSTLDDSLGQLYWKARRRVAQRRAFIDDSDSKWAWREANCRDIACLRTWYATRIDELQRLLASLSGAARPTVSSDMEANADPSTLQCTAAKPGLVVNEQCPSVIGRSGKQWKYQPRDADWFCGVATLEAADTAPARSPLQSQASMQMQMPPQVQASVAQ